MGIAANIASSDTTRPGGERRIAFESPGGIPDVTSETLHKIGSAALLFLDLILKTVRGPGGHVLGGICRLFKLGLRDVS